MFNCRLWRLIGDYKIGAVMKKVHLLLFAVILVLAGCGNKSENKITHLPYQVEKDGRWGLIDWEGNPLIEDEFKHRPSAVIDGMFCVKNSNDMYEIYTAEKKPRQIGEEYLSVGPFTNGLAPVVKKDSRITYINKEGEVVIELTKYNDDPIVKAWPFNNGLALVETASGKAGAINSKGKFAIPPTYLGISNNGDNILLVRNDKDKIGYIDYKGKTLVEPKYSNGYNFDKKGYAVVEIDGKHILIDKAGKELFQLKNDTKIIGGCIDENLIPYCLDNESYGYLNLKGEKEIKLSSNMKNPTSFFNGYAIFKNSDGDYGTIDTKGEVVIRAKYDNLEMIDGFDFMLFEEENEWGLLSYSGDIMKRASYKDIIPFVKGNKYTYAKDGNEWILIDQKGEDTKKIEIGTISFGYNNGYSTTVESDYLDIDAEVKKILSVLNEDGTIDKMTFNMMPKEFEKIYINVDIRDDHISYYLPPSKYLKFHATSIKYSDKIRFPKYERQWIESRWGGYWDNVANGYIFNNNIEFVGLDYFFELQDKLLNRKQDVYKSILKYIENRGYKLSKEDTKGKTSFYIYENIQHRLILTILDESNCIQIITLKN